MGGKRAASKAVASPPAKVPRNTEKEDAVAEACKPVFRVLKANSGPSVAELLCTALPLASKLPKGSEQRHPFQMRLLDAVEKELTAASSRQEATVNALLKEKPDLLEEQGKSHEIEEAIAQRLVETKQECEKAEEAVKSKQEALQAATSALCAARDSVDAADGERQALEKTRDDFASGDAELWLPLKASEMQKNWRGRDRKITQLIDKLKIAGAEISLLEAVSAALKMKTDQRGEFAQATVAYAEECYSKYSEGLKEKVDKFGEEISSRAAAMADAEAGLRAAKEAFDAAMDESCTAQSAWSDERNQQVAHNKKMKTYIPSMEKLEKKLDTATQKYDRLRAVAVGFKDFRAGEPPLSEDVAAPEVAAEAAAADEVVSVA